MNEAREAGRSRDRTMALLVAAVLLAASLLLLALARGLEGGSLDWLRDPAGTLGRLDHDVAMDRISNAAEVVAGVLAILITVVAIVVELAANRYTHRITQLFVHEPLNVGVMGLYVLTAICCLWLSTLPAPLDGRAGVLPSASLVVCMAMVTLCLLSLIPYFAFLFRFLSPLEVIDRIREQAERAVQRGRRGDVDRGRAAVIEATEELEDVARGARDHSDRGISMASVDALAEFVRRYAAMKGDMPRAWFSVSESLARDPDFVAMAPVVLDEIHERGSWLEAKVLRQYFALFAESLGGARDVANLITLNTRRLTEAGELPFDLALQFFNSYLRAAINARDLRTAYYVLHQYRMLAESRMDAGDARGVLEVAEHLRYYGRLGFEVGQAFLLEVVAYDVGLLVERAASSGREEADPLLDLLLTVDSESRREEHEAPIRGVRRAQIQLATFFLEHGDEERARRIFWDLAQDPPARLEAIRREIETETNPQYREFTDRGVNFAYLAPARRAQLARFFGWFTQTDARGARERA